MSYRKISSMTEEEKGEIWKLIGGTPHLFNENDFNTWMEEGEVPEGIKFGAYEIYLVGQYLIMKGFGEDDESPWELDVRKALTL